MRTLILFAFRLLLLNLLVAFFIELANPSTSPLFQRIWMSFRLGLFYLTIFGAGHGLLSFLVLNRFPPRTIAHVQVRILGHLVLSVALFLLCVFLIRTFLSASYLSEETSFFFIGMMVVLLPVMLVFQGYLEEFFKRWKQTEALAAEAQLNALKAQIQPHFLFNSLNTIAGLISNEPEKAEKMTVDVSVLLRKILQFSEKKTVPILDEIGLARHYVDIQKQRFGDRLKVEWTQEITQNWEVPVLFLQPILENAFKHGFQQSGEHFQLNVQIFAGKSLQVSVSDSGPGFASISKSELLKRGSGIRNIVERFERSFPGQFSWTAEGQTFTLEVKTK